MSSDLAGLFLGIDPGTKCGWALLDLERRVSSGTWDCSPRRGEGGGMRYLRLRRHLRHLFEQATAPILAVAYEDVHRHLGTDAAHVYGGIVAVLTEECERRKVPYRGVAVGSVKKLATGKGNADKVAMVAAATTRWGHVPSDDNEADALFVGLALARDLV